MHGFNFTSNYLAIDTAVYDENASRRSISNIKFVTLPQRLDTYNRPTVIG